MHDRRRLAECALCCAFALLFFPVLLHAAEVKPVEVKVSGYGFFGNLQLKKLLRTLQESELKHEVVDANFVENSALILIGRLRDDGFLKPTLEVRMTLVDGSEAAIRWHESIEPPLARPARIRRVHFKIREGVQYHYDTLKFVGLQSISEKQ